jgi:hypothetical protein
MAAHNGAPVTHVEVVVPAGNSQTTAQPIPAKASPALILAAGIFAAGILLPIASKGKSFWIKNISLLNEPLLVYPQVGSQINSLGTNAFMSVPYQTAALFVADANNTWHTIPVVPS